MMRKVASYENDIIVEVNSSMTGIDSLPLLIDLLINITWDQKFGCMANRKAIT